MQSVQHLLFPPFRLDPVNERLWREFQLLPLKVCLQTGSAAVSAAVAGVGHAGKRGSDADCTASGTLALHWFLVCRHALKELFTIRACKRGSFPLVEAVITALILTFEKIVKEMLAGGPPQL